ncbi:MAG: NAD(P)-dependent oxidoreductase [Okeania sp. SIO3H1]|uniref:NAD-dependent epimerase/dehydratase family protein n=1 Tax=Okeania sp. SIO1I7 TaxID=2607772 RepID=UPI0013C7D90D|nr:NAD(P)-dependent oxidoreductase [Okeania sp. SIO1I7]NEN93101.1 NAD(P)-dependent oxidoreductase [Okeania sp. SIO3H1]NET29235.1 NAD(P)-dependent oxidoreductase [Okeania sp. SIO1I7]
MKILVTGGTGFTGSHLTRRLLKKGHEVVVLDNKPGLFYDELKELGAELHIGSVADRDIVDRVTQGCEVVQHLAAAFRQVNLAKNIYWDVNVEGTRYLLEAALKYGVQKFVYCSTCGVHGDVKQTPSGEDSPIAPADYYQYTKYQGEKIIPEFVDKGLKVVILRPAAIYGPGDPERFSILFKRVKTGNFFMCGSGASHYHPLYIDNLLDAFELATASDKCHGETYLIADEKYSTLNDLVTAIAKALNINCKITYIPFWPVWTVAFLTELLYKPFPGLDPPLFPRRVDWFRQNRAFSIEKAKRELGYQPKVDLDTGLAQTAKWYQEKGII